MALVDADNAGESAGDVVQDFLADGQFNTEARHLAVARATKVMKPPGRDRLATLNLDQAVELLFHFGEARHRRTPRGGEHELGFCDRGLLQGRKYGPKGASSFSAARRTRRSSSSDRTRAGCFLAWSPHLSAGRRLKEITLDGPVEHAPDRSENSVGVDGMFIRDLIEKSHHVAAFDAANPAAPPFPQNVAACLCWTKPFWKLRIHLKTKDPRVLLPSSQLAILLRVELDELNGEFVDGLREVGGPPRRLLFGGVVARGDRFHGAPGKPARLKQTKCGKGAQGMLPRPASNTIANAPAFRARWLNDEF